jgi:homoserine dehydrogenase
MSIQNNNKQLTIGLFGFGVVGAALYEVLVQTPTLNATIKKICIRHPEKSRSAAPDLFTTEAENLLSDDDINVIVELTNDPEAAYRIAKQALQSGKAVVSAGKKMISEHLEELIALQKQYDTPFLYEAACCASIPVIRNLEEYYDNDLLHSISGIVNGSTNYILTRMAEGGVSFAEALKEAQVAGFAETDPTLDISGQDAVNKLSILLAHAYGVIVQPSEILHAGITSIQAEDTAYAREKGYRVKLVASARKLSDGRVAAYVLPSFEKPSGKFYEVRNEYNGVEIESNLADKQFFYGKGAGGFPTASAVLSDLSALRYHYRYEYKKLQQTVGVELSSDFCLRVCVSFKSLLHVPHEQFERVEEWVSTERRCHITGVIHFSKLLESDWWRAPGVSLAVFPDSLSEHPIKERSLSDVFVEV